MQVRAENIHLQLGNNGITLRISNNDGSAIGRLEIGRAKLVWSPGRVSKNSTRVPMDRFIDWLNEQQ